MKKTNDMFEKIIDSFEKLCLQVIIDILLIPVTIVKLFRKATFCYDYPVQEMQKEDSERFKDYLSPIKLVFYTSIIVSVIMMDYSGEKSVFGKISGLSMVEKALVLFLINNVTAMLFSAFLIWYKREKINSTAFRVVLFSFLYTTVYTTTPAFLLIISSMGIGQTLNVKEYFNKIAASNALGVREWLLVVIVLLVIVLIFIGLVKLFRAYHYILKENLRYHPHVVRIFALVFFAVQVLYTAYFM